MDVNFFFNTSDKNNPLSNFLLNFKYIRFKNYNINDLAKLTHGNNLLIITNNTKLNDFNRLYNWTSKLDFGNIIYLLPISYYKEYTRRIEKKIFYPKKFLLFIEQLKTFLFQKINLNKDIFLSNDNLLTNSCTNKKVYLTEIESKLISLLIKSNYTNKDEINRMVLGHKANIDSKSLDTHLYRLRNKIIKVTKDIKIEYDDKKNIKLTFASLLED